MLVGVAADAAVGVRRRRGQPLLLCTDEFWGLSMTAKPGWL
jgi:hypothetical protein